MVVIITNATIMKVLNQSMRSKSSSYLNPRWPNGKPSLQGIKLQISVTLIPLIKVSVQIKDTFSVIQMAQDLCFANQVRDLPVPQSEFT